MSDKLVPIAQYQTAEEAHFARMDLKGIGVDSVLDNETMIATDWLYTVATGGIRLFVRQQDAEKAKQILQETQTANPPVDENGQPIFGEDPYDLCCPTCGSEDLRFEKWSRTSFFLGFLLFRIPLPYRINKATCRQCGYSWKQ